MAEKVGRERGTGLTGIRKGLKRLERRRKRGRVCSAVLYKDVNTIQLLTLSCFKRGECTQGEELDNQEIIYWFGVYVCMYMCVCVHVDVCM